MVFVMSSKIAFFPLLPLTNKSHIKACGWVTTKTGTAGTGGWSRNCRPLCRAVYLLQSPRVAAWGSFGAQWNDEKRMVAAPRVTESNRPLSSGSRVLCLPRLSPRNANHHVLREARARPHRFEMGTSKDHPRANVVAWSLAHRRPAPVAPPANVGLASYVNDGRGPQPGVNNARLVNLHGRGDRGLLPVCVLVATRHIAPGDEVMAPYGRSYTGIHYQSGGR